MNKNDLSVLFFLAEENIKAHYFQGDMMLTHHQNKILDNAFKYASKRSDLENRALIKDMARLWPEGKVPYAYAADIGKMQTIDYQRDGHGNAGIDKFHDELNFDPGNINKIFYNS